MTTFHVLSGWPSPGLRLWRDVTAQAPTALAFDADRIGSTDHLHTFQANLDSEVHGDVHALLHQDDAWEKDPHQKTLPRGAQYRIPNDLWMVHAAGRVLTEDPFTTAADTVTIHLITQTRYRNGALTIWLPGQPVTAHAPTGHDADGPFFTVTLAGPQRHWFLFRFAQPSGEEEPEGAIRLWCARDGREIWTHSESTPLSSRAPVKETLIVHYLPPNASTLAQLHLWQDGSGFETTNAGTPAGSAWLQFRQTIYTELPYRFMFKNSDLIPEWEHKEAHRNVFLRDGAHWTSDGDGTERRLGPDGVWTLDGDHELFGAAPLADKSVSLEISHTSPDSVLPAPVVLDVWVNRARGLLHANLAPGPDGRWSFMTFPEVVTSFRFRSGDISEKADRHTLKISAGTTAVTSRFIVVGRRDPLPARPVADLFADPPFPIERPGAWISGDVMRFAVHCPTAATVEVVGQWTGWEQHPVPLRSTRDSSYWWGEVPLATITGALGRPDVHGVFYKLLLNQVRGTQDPAADWVQNSAPGSASRLVDHRLYPWRNPSWQRPGWEYLTIYQLHPSRFSQRHGLTGFAAVERELSDPTGYLRKVNATALLLMPVGEFAGTVGWGYNPSFFYAIEEGYGGPDALKALVDAAHERGCAVLVDLVFNHAGASDNVLWTVANESFFDGDTEWGPMINFDHPQVAHFFEQNLVHLMRNYRIDGFRFDFTRIIRRGHEADTYHVRERGSGGGWGFMKQLQAAVRSVDGRCLMMAEHFPNEFDLTRPHGPMDTQWGDNFHDRLVDVARGGNEIGRLADAIKLTHVECERWHECTFYPESHDEVGNEPNRIVHVGGVGQGLRRNKVAAAATLFARGIPLWFMGAESGEWRQFKQNGSDALDLSGYESDGAAGRIRDWWNRLSALRRGNNRLEGPSPVRVHYAQEGTLAFSRGEAADYFVVLNFSVRSGEMPLAALHLPDGEYKELLNSSWGPYQVENEDEHPNGGWDARLRREYNLNIPDYGVVILERR